MKSRITFEQTIYLLIFFLAFAVRSLNLETAPLSDFEAEWAVRAWEVSRSWQVVLGPQPGYVLLTGWLFFLVRSSNALARILPVLAGSTVVITPFFFRNYLGRKSALVMAFGLAIAPGLVNVSKLAGGPMLALGFLLLVVVALIYRETIATGIFGGLALLSGPAVVTGTLGVVISWAAARLLGVFNDRNEGEGEQEKKNLFGTPVYSGRSVKKSLITGGVILILIGTLFLRFPEGLGAFAAIIPAYLEGWFSSSGVSIFRLLVALMSYQPLALIFGIITTARVWREGDNGGKTLTGRVLSLWLLINLGLVLTYPGRQVADLVWVIIPLWGLASLEISRYLRWNGWKEVQTWTLAIFTLILLTSMWINLAGFVRVEIGSQMFNLRAMIILGSFVLIGLSTLLVALGWSWESATRGMVWGLTLGMTLYLLAFSVRGNVKGPSISSQGIWTPGAWAGDVELLVKTLGKLGEWKTGREDGVNVVSLVDAPSLKWALRKFPAVSFREDLFFDSNPTAVITPQNQMDLRLDSAYRGQDFVGWEFPRWESMTVSEWLRWFVFREVPTVPEYIILWGEVDVFPGGFSTLNVGEFPESETDLPDSSQEIVPDDGPRDGNIPTK